MTQYFSDCVRTSKSDSIFLGFGLYVGEESKASKQGRDRYSRREYDGEEREHDREIK